MALYAVTIESSWECEVGTDLSAKYIELAARRVGSVTLPMAMSR